MPEQHLVLEEDGTSALLAENGTDAILIEEVVQQGLGAGSYSVDGLDATALPVILPADEPFASRGSLGSASEYNFSDYYLDMNPSADVPAGELVLVWCTWTDHYFFGPNDVEGSEVSCTDSQGNRYVQLVSNYVDNGTDENYMAMFVSQLSHRLRTTDTITLKHYGPGAKAMSVWQVSLREDQRWGFLRERLARVGSHATDPPSITISSLLAGAHYLLMHLLAAKGPNADAYTWDADYERIDDAGTNTGNADAGSPSTVDVHVRGGLRIVSGITTDTVDVTSTTADRKYGQALAALVAFTSDEDFAEFPNTPLIDDFNRANEDPTDGSGLWDKTGGRPGFGTAYTRVVGNQAAMSSSGSGSGSEFVAASVTTDDNLGEAEVWGTIAVMGDAVLYMLSAGAGHLATFDGMGVGYRDAALRALNADTRGIVASVWFPYPGFGGDLPNDPSIAVWGKRANGTKIGIQQLQAEYLITHLWMDEGNGWEWVTALLKSSSRFDGKFGMAFEGDTATRIDNFGGGILHREPGQIIRKWPPRAPLVRELT